MITSLALEDLSLKTNIRFPPLIMIMLFGYGKGDYWNLGAGAEIGIYIAKTQEQYDNNFYEVDENLVLDVNMDIKYRTLSGLLPITLNNLTQRNWWVCSFSPAI